MLVLKRNEHERVRLRFGETTIWVEVVEIGRGVVRLGFDAPRAVAIQREEIISPREADADQKVAT